MSDYLYFECKCGFIGYVKYHILDNYYAFCPKCNLKHVGVTCEKCKTGFQYPENSKHINLKNKTWKCDCKKINSLNPSYKKQAEVYKGKMPKYDAQIELSKRVEKDLKLNSTEKFLGAYHAINYLKYPFKHEYIWLGLSDKRIMFLDGDPKKVWVTSYINLSLIKYVRKKNLLLFFKLGIKFITADKILFISVQKRQRLINQLTKLGIKIK